MTSIPLPDAATGPTPRRWHAIVRVALIAIAIAAIAWIWPARFGGDTTVLAVEGNSMQPTFNNGDLVVARHRDRYDVGDIVVFRVPTTPGNSANVVHRIIAKHPDGSITTQGDNRATADGFPTTTRDIIGQAQFHIANGATALRVLSQWWLLSLLTGALVTARLWPNNNDPERPTQTTTTTVPAVAGP